MTKLHSQKMKQDYIESFCFQEFERILNLPTVVHEEMRSMRLFLTGGTGFFGRWLVESILWLNLHYNLNIHATILTRNQQNFLKRYPKFRNKGKHLKFLRGDIRNFDLPSDRYTHIIHGATTSAEETFLGQDPLLKFDTIVSGTRRCLDLAVKTGAKKFLYLSSGAAYGKQPSDMEYLIENYSGGPLTTNINFDHSALGEGKRAAEILTTIYSQRFGLHTCIARCFSFVGPGLPLGIHYAIGNFIGAALKDQQIVIKGDGSPIRSYLYVIDLINWIWRLLALGKNSNTYNVGSDQRISLLELANLIDNTVGGKKGVIVKQKSSQYVDQYVPNIEKIKGELNIPSFMDLEESIKATAQYLNSV